MAESAKTKKTEKAEAWSFAAVIESMVQTFPLLVPSDIGMSPTALISAEMLETPVGFRTDGG